MTRRTVLKGLAGAGLCALAGGALYADWNPDSTSSARQQAIATPPPLPPHAREALYYTHLGGGPDLGNDTGSTVGHDIGFDCTSCHAPAEPSHTLYCHVPHQGRFVRCNLCPHRCVLAEGERGICRVRENRAGKLYTLVYGNPCAVNVDPIEKKPFFHFLPGTTAFSLATAGCNLRCQYCQNYNISQYPPEKTQNLDAPPEAVVSASGQRGAPTIAYTYSEPTVFYEYMLDIARLARRFGLRNAVISAGYVNPEPLRELCRAVDAIKIDLKGVNEDFYRQVCSGTLEPVLMAIRTIHEMGVHLEIVNLVVPTLNDDLAELRDLARWMLDTLGPDVPLHFSRFHPQYQLLHLPPTPIETLEAARQAALDVGLHYVYLGNVPGHEGSHTYCPHCGQRIIERAGMATSAIYMVDGRCAFCQASVAGVWQ